MDAVVLKDSVTGQMTDGEFLRFCLENPDLRIERNSNLEIIIMSPVGTLSGYSSGQAFAQLAEWNKNKNTGLVFESSAGFTLPDRSVLSPDASWLSRNKWAMLSQDEKERFAPVCPEFVIEVRSKSDSIDMLKKKMQVWIKNGAELAWLIDPIGGCSWIYKQGGSENEVKGFNDVKLVGEGPVEGFVLNLSLLKTS
jgi:Uma2 family endonuclease